MFFMAFAMSYAQDTLFEQNSIGYSRYFVLDKQGGFKYFFIHCTGISVASGTYVKSNKNIRFFYDPIITPESVVIKSRDFKTDSISIELIDILDSTKIYLFEVRIDNQNYIPKKGKITFPNDQFETSRIAVIPGRDTIRFNISPEFNVYKIYAVSPIIEFVVSNITKLKHREDYYYYKTKYRDIDQDKPWKNGKSRTVGYMYRFEDRD